jgi:hypothetical protein
MPPTTTSPQATNVYNLPRVSALVHLHHASTGNPVHSTWFAAIKAGNYDTFPSLTLCNAMKHCPSSNATIKGYLKQMCQGLCSTKPKPSSNCFTILSALDKPPTEAPSVKPISKPTKLPLSSELFIIDLPLSKLYTDDTGRLPIQACIGNQYITITYHSQFNVIL